MTSFYPAQGSYILFIACSFCSFMLIFLYTHGYQSYSVMDTYICDITAEWGRKVLHLLPSIQKYHLPYKAPALSHLSNRTQPTKKQECGHGFV
ncbi:hypothetical protein I7I53_11155 [Histoplasma capsulatum var. duboisii H88]|uniref:Uncharacterized protein n=1 Tax=Ajellomyces capsulatus (strain H88) TaxID=544711 RepID=A0A8A1LA02_AJEC8|nr:hypothetical protein I7I53_11155 [Histoplasma capsulatum var. duboisii H88]